VRRHLLLTAPCALTLIAQAARLHRGIRRSELVLFERSGHYPFVEEPAAFQRAVRTWIAGDT